MGVVKNATSTGGHITQKMRFEMRFEIEMRKVKWGLIIAFGDGKGRNKFLCFIDKRRLHLFQSSLHLAREREETHGYVLWRKTIFIFSVIRGIIISRRFHVYNRKNVFDFCCWKVWGVLKCKNLWVWSGKCIKCI